MIKYGRTDPRYYYAKDFRLDGFSHPLYPDRQVDKYPSATSILSLLDKPALRQWAANCAVDYILQWSAVNEADPEWITCNKHIPNKARFAYKNISKEARDTGTDIHELCQAHLEQLLAGQVNNLPDLYENAPENQQKLFDKFLLFCNKHHVKPLAIEKKCWAVGWGCRLDVVWEIDKFWDRKHKKDRVVALCDFKTGKGRYYNEWGLQLASNRQAFNKVQTESVVSYHGILKFNKETLKVNYKDFSPFYERDLDSFEDLMRFWWKQNENNIEENSRKPDEAVPAEAGAVSAVD